MAYLLEVHCLLRYEASQDLRDGILNNWLVNITGEVGKWIEADLLQEHYNRWLEDMVKKRGGDFDDKFYHHTLSPNVDHFLWIKEEIENAFSLRSCGKTHTSPHLRDELRVLLALYKEEHLHLFCTGRTLGHAAINQFNEGYTRLDTGKLDDFISKSTAYADVIAEIQAYKRTEGSPETVPLPDHPGMQDQLASQLGDNSDDINISPPPSESSNSSDSSTPLSSSASTQSEDDNDGDPSDAHLVSGSDYNIYLSDNQLTHETWYEYEHGDSSGDEDDNVYDKDSDGDNSDEENDLYDSE